MGRVDRVHLIFRTIWYLITARFRSRIDPYGVSVTPFRVLPTDIDINRHLNNGVYFSLADIARYDMLVRAGLFGAMQRRGWYPVAVAETITFRRSLEPGQKFTIESKIVGVDEKAVFIEQRFVVAGQIYARMTLRARFLSKRGGLVAITDILDVMKLDASKFAMPSWIAPWAEETALPPARAEAPSEWT